MESGYAISLLGSEIHGFRTMHDLDFASITKEAGSRWLRPNEIHAILSNYTNFTVKIKPVNLPKSGEIVLFDRKMLRNFRKDGHNWKKKKDGKTVKEAHEHLKVGTEERIHVYYAHGLDDPNFVRRCYWLLDKSLEHIVLVHYRQTQEGSPVTTLNSHSGSTFSELSPPQLLPEETDSGANNVVYTGFEQVMAGESANMVNHDIRLHEINTLEWDQLLASNDFNISSMPGENYVQLHGQSNMNDSAINGGNFLERTQPDGSYTGNFSDLVADIGSMQNNQLDTMLQPMTRQMNPSKKSIVYDNLSKDGLQFQPQDSFSRWMNAVMADSPGSVEDTVSESSLLSCNGSLMPSETAKHGKPLPEQIFCINDVSPTWASSTEETKILVVGCFHEDYQHLSRSNMFCVCDDKCVPAEVVQVGVYRCVVPPHSAGVVCFFLSIDGFKPISQVVTLEFRAPVYNKIDVSADNSWEGFRLQMRLAHLLFSTSKCLEISAKGVPPHDTFEEAKKFSLRCASIKNSWSSLMKQIENGKVSLLQAKESLFEITLKNRLKDWLLERVLHGSKFSERDSEGQGVLHLCAILGYTWAVYPFSMAGLSLDFRDKSGWTALHWAAYCGREKMVAALLSAEAKPNLVTDPSSENPSGLTAADLAYKKGYDGLAAYLSEKALVQQFEDMKIAGNAKGSLETAMLDPVNISSQNEEEIYLKDTLTAYRTAAGAAARIQEAFRENSFKKKTKVVQRTTPEMEARYIVAAMKIQNAYRNFEIKRKMAAAARIQYRFRSWKLRREFLNIREQTIKIQAAFRGFQVRRQYKKICWSVGVLEKVILRWRKRRKGLRGLEIKPTEIVPEQNNGDTEEDFYRASRKQAEERVERAVVRVQAMFRSKHAQQEYRRMKQTHDQLQNEFEDSINDSSCLDT
ncbi:hypothetical protein V2J09_013463 [Rumex salicifolius]